MRRILTVLFFGICTLARSADAPYAVSLIPETLKKDANIIIRAEEKVFEVTPNNEAILRNRYVYTILNENGKEQASLAIFYDKMRKVGSIEGSLYDGNGKLIQKLKAKDIRDFSAVDNISLIDDNRVKVHSFNHLVYPYTIEYETEIRFNTNYFFPDWIPVPDERIAIEKSSFTLITPPGYPVRFKAFNYKGEPVVSTDKGKQISTWKVENLPAVISPFAAPTWNEQTTAIYIAPSLFEMEGYKGDASTWEGLGKFARELNQGRDKLPEATLQTVKQLTAGLTEDKQKVTVLYEYLQKNTRYISIQLGIGGLQPFEASFVAQKGYGDCKALSNYMYSLLKAAGIKSYYTLIRAGESKNDRYLLEDFPKDKFNHIVVCVPLSKDTMWLECTDQYKAPGYMGGFTGNRKALLITEEGGKLVATPRYGLNENLQVRKIKGVLSETGDLNATIHTTYAAMQQDDLHMTINQLSKEKLKEFLNRYLELSSYDINDFKYKERKSSLPEIDEELNLTVNRFATVSGKRMFITPNLLNRNSTSKLVDDKERTSDFVLTYEFRDVDSVEISIPDGYELEAKPENLHLKTPFGSYQASVKFENNKVTYIRTREQYKGRHPSKDYKSFMDYNNAIYKADHSRMVLVKKG